jgi:uncharacterized protein (DUF2249 family)
MTLPAPGLPVIDVATLAAGSCRATIEGTFEALQPGQALEIVVGHDPDPLRRRFAVERPGRSRWTYLESGPSTWRVRVERVA